MKPSLKFRADLIRKGGDKINEAVNSWSRAPEILDGAFLPENCFGKVGEEIGVRAYYEKLRAQTILKLNEGSKTLIANREAVYTAASRYDHTEIETTNASGQVHGHGYGPGNSDPSDYGTRYGWARDPE